MVAPHSALEWGDSADQADTPGDAIGALPEAKSQMLATESVLELAAGRVVSVFFTRSSTFASTKRYKITEKEKKYLTHTYLYLSEK